MDASENEVKLTVQEQKVLALMAEGKLCSEMAEELGLTEQTIKWYRMRLRAKFNASTSSAVIRQAMKLGLL